MAIYRLAKPSRPGDRFDKFDLKRDDNSVVTLKVGSSYDLSTTELARIAPYIDLVADPTGIYLEGAVVVDPGSGGSGSTAFGTTDSPRAKATRRRQAAAGGLAKVKSNRRAIIELRFDDTPAGDYTTLFPLLEARSLVAGFAVASTFVSGTGPLTYQTELLDRSVVLNASLGQGCSVPQLVEMQSKGMEMLSHTRYHADPTALSNGGASAPPGITLSDYIKQDLHDHADKMREVGLNPILLAQPGTQSGDYYIDFDAELDTVYGREIMDEFPVFEGYIKGASGIERYRPFPSDRFYGYQCHTVEVAPSGSATQLAAMQAVVDTAIRMGSATGFLCHFLKIGTGGHMTLADLTTWLDYIQTKRDAGLIDVLTPSAAYFVQPGTPDSLLADGSFQLVTAGSPGVFTGSPWQIIGSPVVTAAGTGHGGGTNKAIQTVGTTAGARQYLNPRGMRHFRVEGWARAVSQAANGNARMIVRGQDISAAQVTNVDKQWTVPLGASWTQFKYNFGVDYRTTEQQVWLGSGAASVEYSDLAVYAT